MVRNNNDDLVFHKDGMNKFLTIENMRINHHDDIFSLIGDDDWCLEHWPRSDYRNCIQPQLSSSAEINVVCQSEVEIVYYHHNECSQGSFDTIMIATRDLCRDYSATESKTEMDDEICLLKVTLRRPDGEDKSFAFYSTLDSFFSYTINW
ncbi:hypothetical protein ACTXT7_017265, partial [Hymenolepis weldensis]